jgi:hypothetical protein
MFKRIWELEARIGRMKDVFKQYTGYDLMQIKGVGKNEIYFSLEGFYQEFMEDRLIEITIREINSLKKGNFSIYVEQLDNGEFLKIEQVVKDGDYVYLIIFEMIKSKS